VNDKNALSVVLITLFKGVLYREEQESIWQELLRRIGQVQDYLSILGLELLLFEDEGFAYVSSRESEEGEEALPNLIPRRQLTYTVSLILALLRRSLADHDASGGEERLVMEKGDLIEQILTFYPSGTNEAKLVNRIESNLRKIESLGFIRFLGKDADKVEVKRIIKAFIDAQWLGEFDRRLGEYAEYSLGEGSSQDDGSAFKEGAPQEEYSAQEGDEDE
jgi:hypothetical protein